MKKNVVMIWILMNQTPKKMFLYSLFQQHKSWDYLWIFSGHPYILIYVWNDLIFMKFKIFLKYLSIIIMDGNISIS